MHLVDVIAGGLVRFAVDGDAVPHRVLHDEHSDFLELLAQLLDVEADDAVFNIDAGAVVEHVQGAGDVNLQRRGNILGFLFLLRQKGIVQILQHGHILRNRRFQILSVDHADAAVDDGLFHRLQALLAAHDQFAQGEDEVRFQ